MLPPNKDIERGLDGGLWRDSQKKSLSRVGKGVDGGHVFGDNARVRELLFNLSELHPLGVLFLVGFCRSIVLCSDLEKKTSNAFI